MATKKLFLQGSFKILQKSVFEKILPKIVFDFYVIFNAF